MEVQQGAGAAQHLPGGAGNDAAHGPAGYHAAHASEAVHDERLLLGLPLPTLHALLSRLTSREKVALMQTCRAMQTAVLDHAPCITLRCAARSSSYNQWCALLARRTETLHLSLAARPGGDYSPIIDHAAEILMQRNVNTARPVVQGVSRCCVTRLTFQASADLSCLGRAAGTTAAPVATGHLSHACCFSLGW